MAVSHASPADMALENRLPMFRSPAEIPLTYRIGERVFRGIPDDFSPRIERRSVDSNITEYRIVGKSPDNITVTAEALCYHDFPVVEWFATLSNEGDKATGIVSDIRWVTEIVGTDPILCHSNGDNQTETGYSIFYDRIDSEISMTPEGGLPNANAFPYMRILMNEWYLNLAIGWPGMWTAEFSPSENGTLISVKQNRCHMKILPGETMRTPRLTFMAAGDSEDHARNLWRKWYFKHIIPTENGKPLGPMYVLCDQIPGHEEFTASSTETQCRALETYIAHGLRPDIWWLDAGWYPNDTHWWSCVGTWRHDPERFPNGLGELGRMCEENGVRFLLWFEPERVRDGSEIHAEHSDWLISFDDWPEHMLDLSKREAVDWLTDNISEKIEEYHVHIYRQDFNTQAMAYWNYIETEDRIGAIENGHIQGYLAYWDALLDRHPGILLDSCASGGRRNDLDTMRRSVPLHYTDVGYGNHPVKQKQFRLMFEWIPYFRTLNQNWDDENGNYPGTVMTGKWDEFAFHGAMSPATANQMPYNSSEEDFELAKKMEPIWRRAAEIELRGDYYPLTECRGDAHDWYAMQFDDPERADGFVQIVRNTLAEEDTFVLRMKAVRETATYRFENQETGEKREITGKELIDGVTMTMPRRSAAVWFYRADT